MSFKNFISYFSEVFDEVFKSGGGKEERKRKGLLLFFA